MAASGSRAACAPTIAVVEEDGVRLKFNPFANVSREEIEAIYARANLPPHPLVTVRLSVGRLHALHQPELDRRRRARRPLARPGQDRMRHPYREDFVASRSFRIARLCRPWNDGQIRPPRSPFSHGWYATTPVPFRGNFESCGRSSPLSGCWRLAAARRRRRSRSRPCMPTWPVPAPGSIRRPRRR